MTDQEDFSEELGGFIDTMVGKFVAQGKISKWEQYPLSDPPGGQGLLYFKTGDLYLKITITEEDVPE